MRRRETYDDLTRPDVGRSSRRSYAGFVKSIMYQAPRKYQLSRTS